jgi:eukaryotic-like serine/threonine-protein kinase
MGGLPTGAGALVGQRLGKYDLLALLALGGTAEIYLARIDGTAGFEKFVVVKCLHDHLAEDPEFVSMFLDEARLGAQLDHSNIVQTLGLGEHDGRYYLVMELIAGLSLALVGRRAHERVRGGLVPVPIVLEVAAQAAAGLHYAHQRGEGGQPLHVVHRDVSPQNLVITFEGIVKVVDFGIAKADRRETQTRSGTVKGKFAYMAPEQCLARDVDRRADVFALGVVIWELLTGRRLFKRSSTYETYQAVLACQVPPPSSVNHELDPALDALVLPALAADREARYPTAEALAEAVVRYLHHRGKPSGPGEIARFFEAHFGPELDDHVARMRELVEGRRKSIAEQRHIQWDASELDGSASVLDPETLDRVMDASASLPGTRGSAAAGGAVGPVTPPLASRAATVPARPQRVLETVPDVDAQPGEDFEAGAQTDAEAQAWREDGAPADATRIETNPMALAAERPVTEPEPPRLPTAPEPPSRPLTSPRPEPPPRRASSVVTPAGLRAGGAPLDLSAAEREQMLAMAAPPSAALPAGRPAMPALVPTVVAEPHTQMLTTADLLEVATDPLMPAATPPPADPAPSLADPAPSPADRAAPVPTAAALPAAAQLVAMPLAAAPRRLPPWTLAVMFVVVLVLATAITVAIARVLVA